jgi:long-chain acyl-CoA synthetase
MNTTPTLQSVINSLGEHGEKTAVLAITRRDQQRWSYRSLGDCARSFASGLVKAGFKPGDSIALFAENRPEWIAAVLGVIRAGCVAVPVDIQFGDDDLTHILRDSDARAIITTQRWMQRVAKIYQEKEARFIVLDADDERSWKRLLQNEPTELPVVSAHDLAVLFYTSGTTGPPKGVPLSHGNVGSQLATIARLNVLTESDRVLLPLPLHHVYPFVIGMLAPLSLGVPLILPFSLTGPQLLRALRDGEVTAIVGVPRLYSALYSGISAGVESSGRLARRLFKGLVAFSTFLQRSLRLRVGKTFFRSVHKRLGKNLRLLASGGSALDPELAVKLESLGWQVAIGYGLTETSPLLSIKLPDDARRGSVGKAFPGVEIKIQPGAPEAREQSDHLMAGEILALGPNVFAGYRNLPEQTAAAFTTDGWFRTGDIGYFDEDQFLYVVGRISSLIKTESGEKIQTEDVEVAYAKEPAIREIGVLEKSGKLVALIVPERAACGADVARAVRIAIETASRKLPSYERIFDYAITRDALPHTRLGKIQRHRLRQRFEVAKSTGGKAETAGPMALEEMSGEDRALFEEPVANCVWQLLARRYPGKRLTPDTSLQFDLAVDSLEWLNLTLEVAESGGVEVTEEAIARIDSVRDLLREVLEAGEGTGIDPLVQPDAILTQTQKRWLAPLGPAARLTARVLYAFGRVAMRLLFRVRAEGLENLPADRAWVITPNHVSYLDPFALAAVLNSKQLSETYWAGWTGIVSANAFMRLLSRLGKILPVEPTRAARTGLALGAIILKRGHNLVWFPEGGRSPTGELQEFKPGVGMLLQRLPRTVVPVSIQGSREALPPGGRLPRLRTIRVVIGKPCTADELMREGYGQKPHQRIANALQERVAQLARQD